MSLGVGTLSPLADVKPQHYADNLKCSAVCPIGSLLGTSGQLDRMSLLASVSSSALLKRSGRASSSGMCREMVSLARWSWMSRILVVILTLPEGRGAGTLSRLVKEATPGVAAVGALPMGGSGQVGAWFGVSICQRVCMLLKRPFLSASSPLS